MYMASDNKAIGKYITDLIQDNNYNSDREFCRHYIALKFHKKVEDVDGSEIQNMANRLCQIKKGEKGIQIEDLPLFSTLLGVSVDAILSAGTFLAPATSRLTNYTIAHSDNPDQWEAYVNREDKLILNPDEYNKTVIDYALDAGNYPFLKYLMDKEYIWFVGEDIDQYFFSFGAGTSIERRHLDYDNLDIRMKETDELRLRMIVLAIKNGDLKVLESLHAREIPLLYNLSAFSHHSIKDWPSPSRSIEQLIESLSECDNSVLSYFFEEFEIESDRSAWSSTFVFPYASLLLDALVNKNRKSESKHFLEKAIAHNEKTLGLLTKLTSKSKQYFKHLLSKTDRFITYSDDYFDHEIWRDYVVYPQLHFVAYHMPYAVKDSFGFVTNIFKVSAHSSDKEIQLLINELNQTYDAFVEKEVAAHARTIN